MIEPANSPIASCLGPSYAVHNRLQFFTLTSAAGKFRMTSCARYVEVHAQTLSLISDLFLTPLRMEPHLITLCACSAP